MTEYDFSPEGQQRYLATMRRISSWVDQTENHRSQFANAAALITPESMESSYRRESSTRRPPPPPLNLPPLGHSYPHPPPPPRSLSSSSSSSEDFAYANGLGSPGPMPTSTYRPPAPAYGPRALPTFSHPNSSPRSPAFSHTYRSPTYPMPPPSPFVQYPMMTPGYIAVSPRTLRRRKSSQHKSSKSIPYMVSPLHSRRYCINNTILSSTTCRIPYSQKATFFFPPVILHTPLPAPGVASKFILDLEIRGYRLHVRW